MSNYTFAELLTCFYHLHQDLENRKTQAELAGLLGINRRTLTNWFSGNYVPRQPAVVETLARVLSLTAFQADLLLYSVDPTWVKYGTPATVLAAAEIVRYREEAVASLPERLNPLPSLSQIEHEWRVVFQDTFVSNYHRWGVGVKENGICRLERRIRDGYYELSLENQYHEDVFMGGDSNCFAPDIYYLTLKARLIQGESDDDGYGIMFEEINDECYALLRIRERQRQVSVVQTFTGGDHAQVYLRRKPAPAIQRGTVNKVGILALHAEHWFYINDTWVGHCVLPRLPYSRLDVSIIAGSRQTVVCHFQDLRLYAPSAAHLSPSPSAQL
ncbi:MAG: helix-turn-helix transcriptional regulator [Caldilineaceae bacterium]|nr:helix-turn-helix transcriptional regulator [Caldilineaceae bacterium]